MAPGSRRFRILASILSGADCCVSNVRMLHPIEVYPNCRTAFAIVGLVTPNGGRNKVTGCEVTRSSSHWQVCRSFFILESPYSGNKPEWLYEWFPIRWPSVTILFNKASFPFILCPIQKKQAVAWYSFSTFNTLGVWMGSGPSSKVRATTFSVVRFLQNDRR